jgi:hypothetical protein
LENTREQQPPSKANEEAKNKAALSVARTNDNKKQPEKFPLDTVIVF